MKQEHKEMLRLLSMLSKESSKEEVLAVFREADELDISLGPVLTRISETLLGDKEVVLEAIKHSYFQFKNASPELQRDEQFVEEVRKTLEEQIQRDRQADGYPLLTKEELAEMIERILKGHSKKLQQRETVLSALEAEAIRDTAELKEFESKEGQNI